MVNNIPDNLKHLLSLVLVTIIAILSVLYLYPFHLKLSYLDTDFVDYCIAVATFDDPNRLFPPKRSKLAGLIPWMWSTQFGVLKGLSLGAASCFIGCCLITFQWGKRYSAGTGYLALAIFLSMSPALATSRMLNFYPEICFFLLLGAYLVSTAMHHKTMLSFLMGGIGVAMSILCDVRGLIWGLIYIPILLAFSYPSANWVVRCKRVGAILVPIWLSWFVGWWNSHPYSTSLIRQSDLRPLLDELQSSGQMTYNYPAEFVWGYGNPIDLPANLLFLWNQQGHSLPQELSTTTSTYWLISTIIIGLSCAILLWKKREEWPLLLVLIPFALAFWSIGSQVESHVRFYSQSLPVFAVPIALSLCLLFKNNKAAILICCLISPVLAAQISPQWSVEREISTKMLLQAFPQEKALKNLNTRAGQGVHIQTLPLSQSERQIAQDWDMICTEALRQDGVWKLYWNAH